MPAIAPLRFTAETAAHASSRGTAPRKDIQTSEEILEKYLRREHERRPSRWKVQGGDEVDALVVQLDPKERRIGLSVIHVEKGRLCGGDLFKKDNFKDVVLRLIPYVTARNIKRDLFGSDDLADGEQPPRREYSHESLDSGIVTIRSRQAVCTSADLVPVF
jgi:hypothetical protein